MKAILTALAAISTMATSTALAADGSASGTKVAANVHPLYATVPDPGYIVYAGYTGALPGPNCYWTRKPIFDLSNNVVGWRGRPVAVCP